MKLITLKKAKQIIADGGVLIMPTDTAYGVTCDVNNPDAVKRISNIKGRESEKSFTIHIGELNMLDEWVEKIPDDARRLMNKFWPGDLNIVFISYRFVPYITKETNNGNTVAIRMPDHEVPLELSKDLRNAIIGTSANFSGKEAVYKVEDLDPEFVKLTDGVVEGECGGKKASAVVGFENGELKVYREGEITAQDINNALTS